MRCGRRRSAPPAATSERLTSGTPSLAPRAATMRSQASAISSPPATPKPSIAAISGLRDARWTMPAKPRSPTHGRSPVTNALRSMPALNPAPAPVRTPTLSSASSSSVSSAAAIPSASARLTALRASGRLSVMSSTPSRRSVSTGWSFMGGTLEREGFAKLVDVLVVQAERVHVAVPNDALLVDREDRPPRAHHRPPRAVGLGDGAVLVGQQRDGQAVPRDEVLVGLEPLRRDPDDRRAQAVEVLGLVAIRAELLGADRRVVAGIEQEHDALAAVLGQSERSVGALELEVRGLVAFAWCL